MSSMRSCIEDILRQEADAILNIPPSEHIAQAIDTLYQRVHQEQGKVVVSGMGKAGQIGINIATTFCSTGTPAIFLHPSEAQHGDLGIIQAHDVLLLLSNSGKTREILELIGLADKLHRDLPCIVITGNPDSPLAKCRAIVLHTGGPKEVCPLGLTPTTSTTTMTVLGDILTVLMMTRIGFKAEDYAKRHHSGYLNTKARQPSQ